jgi:hypothetical protein
MRNKLELLVALGIIALVPLGLMTITWLIGSFAVWDIIPVGWGFLRVGLVLGLFLSTVAACDEEFKKIFKE